MTSLNPSYSNPANAAMPYYNQIPGTITPYYQPYIDSGQQSLSDLMNQYKRLINDPGAVIQMAGSGFQESPGYQYQYNQGMNAENSAAAAGGMLGTPYHQENAAATAENLANQDYYNYLSNALGLYKTGLSGEEGINKMGYNASDELAQSLASNLMNQGGLAYNAQAQNNQQSADFWNTLIGLGTGLLSYL